MARVEGAKGTLRIDGQLVTLAMQRGAVRNNVRPTLRPFVDATGKRVLRRSGHVTGTITIALEPNPATTQALGGMSVAERTPEVDWRVEGDGVGLPQVTAQGPCRVTWPLDTNGKLSLVVTPNSYAEGAQVMLAEDEAEADAEAEGE